MIYLFFIYKLLHLKLSFLNSEYILTTNTQWFVMMEWLLIIRLDDMISTAFQNDNVKHVGGDKPFVFNKIFLYVSNYCDENIAYIFVYQKSMY